MYVPEPFAEERPDHLIRFLDSRGLATLVHCNADGIDMTHVPVFRAKPTPADTVGTVDGLLLVTHIARANPLWRRIAVTPSLTVMWLGEQSYVSADWYASHPSVPTWNYSALHLHCSARTFDDPQRLLHVLDRTATIFEPRVGGTWRRDNGNAAYVAELLPGIIGIELTVLSHEAIFKLHQNHPPDNVMGAVDGLRRQKNSDCHAVANAMQERLCEREAQTGKLVNEQAAR